MERNCNRDSKGIIRIIYQSCRVFFWANGSTMKLQSAECGVQITYLLSSMTRSGITCGRECPRVSILEKSLPKAADDCDLADQVYSWAGPKAYEMLLHPSYQQIDVNESRHRSSN